MGYLTVRSMKLFELANIYYHHMKRDFPKNELRPFLSIALLKLKKQYTCVGLWRDSYLVAYANLLRSDLSPCVMLDYFAVMPSERNGGYGSKFLKELKNFPLDGIILEAEMPDYAKDETDLIKRQRRIAFYEKNGVRITNVTGEIFGVFYQILYLPIQKDYEDTKIKQELEHMYHLAVPKKIYQKNISIQIN